MVIENKEIVKELIRLGYEWVCIEGSHSNLIYAAKFEVRVVRDHSTCLLHNHWDKYGDVLDITPFVTNPHNLKWDESIAKLEELL